MTPAKHPMRLCLAFAAGCPGPHHCHTALPLQDVVFSARVRRNPYTEQAPPHRETHALMAADKGRAAMSCNGGGIPESINPNDEKGINVLQTNCHRAVEPHTASTAKRSGLWSVGYQVCLHIISPQACSESIPTVPCSKSPVSSGCWAVSVVHRTSPLRPRRATYTLPLAKTHQLSSVCSSPWRERVVKGLELSPCAMRAAPVTPTCPDCFSSFPSRLSHILPFSQRGNTRPPPHV